LKAKVGLVESLTIVLQEEEDGKARFSGDFLNARAKVRY
jgi:hypothetical protein